MKLSKELDEFASLPRLANDATMLKLYAGMAALLEDENARLNRLIDAVATDDRLKLTAVTHDT